MRYALCAAYAQTTVSSAQLLKSPAAYDGQIVVYEGEVIGDIMERGGFAWLNVHDTHKAIGVWAPQALLSGIHYCGSYNTKGDWVEITGIFNRADPEHGGELDLHAQEIKIISPGRPVERKINLSKRNYAFVLLGVLFLVWILSLLKRR